jgi:hypothetical protein
MKKLFLLILTIISLSSFAQEHDCYLLKNPNYTEPDRTLYRTTVQAQASTSVKYVFNVKFHYITDGTTAGATSGLGLDRALNAIMILNTNYNQFNIFFKYKGFDKIVAPQFMNINAQANTPNVSPSDPTFTAMINYSKTGMANPVYDYNAMNLFVVDKIDKKVSTGAAQVAGVAYIPGIDSAYTMSQFLTSTLPHEIAHNFNVQHTWENSGDYFEINNVNTWTPNQAGERVNGSNWATAGDFIQDTPASHKLNQAGFINVLNPCQYVNPNQIADYSGTVYNNVPYKNFMSTGNGCRQLAAGMLPGIAEFTVGQGTYMRNHLAAYINSPTNAIGYANAKTTVIALYEPFDKIPQVSNTILSITDDFIQNGMSIVCRNLSGYLYRYQKGFTYTFNRFDEITNQNISQIPAYLDSGTFTITQLDPTYAHKFGMYCWRGATRCALEPMAGGKLYSTQNLGSMILTETILTATELENPNLIQNLEPHTYNIIQQTTMRGETKSETIYKP